MAIHLALALVLAETLLLALVLAHWARRVAGAPQLIVFLLGVATWVVGNELPNWLGLHTAPLALGLLATVPLTSAAFLHFCLAFCRRRWPRGVLAAAYALAAAAVVLSLVRTPGEFIHFPPFSGVQWVVVPNAYGWATSVVWALLALAGLGVLARALLDAGPAQRRQIAAVAASCAWGLACMSGYAFAALQWPLYPWQVLAVPAYPVILVYGILRYQVFVANAWARRALAWTLLIALGLAVVPLTLLLPLESRWLSAALVAVICLALNGPVRRLAERLVYPGGTASAQDLLAWRQGLARAATMAELSSAAAALVSARIGVAVAVHLGQEHSPSADAPALHCRPSAQGWLNTLHGFDAAPPGPRHLAELFGAVLADAADRVALAQAAQQQERDRQLQARLAELGALAGTVAHDLRNPLNIIAMAVAAAPADTRQEVGEQVSRIARLADDLLDYAKPWRVEPAEFDVAQRVREAVRRRSGVSLGPGLGGPVPLRADPMRFDQALSNLLTNACSAAGDRRVEVDAEERADAVLLHVCDDGPGVPPDLRQRLFEPFASRTPGGTGLGLAIVARVMASHGGTVALTERPRWRTCFTLSFPRAA